MQCFVNQQIVTRYYECRTGFHSFVLAQLTFEFVMVRRWFVVFVMAALRSRCGHYIFALWFLLSSFFSFLA